MTLTFGQERLNPGLSIYFSPFSLFYFVLRFTETQGMACAQAWFPFGVAGYFCSCNHAVYFGYGILYTLLLFHSIILLFSRFVSFSRFHYLRARLQQSTIVPTSLIPIRVKEKLFSKDINFPKSIVIRWQYYFTHITIFSLSSTNFVLIILFPFECGNIILMSFILWKIFIENYYLY